MCAFSAMFISYSYSYRSDIWLLVIRDSGRYLLMMPVEMVSAAFRMYIFEHLYLLLWDPYGANFMISQLIVSGIIS